MPRIYRIVTAVLAATGSLALVAGGEVSPAISLLCTGLIPGYYRAIMGRVPAPRWFVSMLAFLALVFFGGDALVNRDVFLAVAHLTLIIQVVKSFDLREPWDHLQVYFVSLLQLVIVTEMTSSVIFALIFVVFMAVLVAGMVLSHFLKEGALGRVAVARLVVVLVILTMSCTMLLFVLLPRTPYRFVGKGHMRGIKTAGFSERVDFGSFGAVKLDPVVVMRIEMEGPRPPALYWRGVSLDFFDGETWRNSAHARQAVIRADDVFSIAPFDRKAATVQRIFREPIDSDVIFGLAAVKAVRSDAFRMFVDSDQGIHLPGKATQKVMYTMYSIPEGGTPGRPDKRYLQVPKTVAGLEGLSGRIVAGADGAARKAAGIEAYLKKNYAYSLTPRRPPPGVNPIEDFLFTSKQGYCEHYATSMVLLLRTQGIPARIVTGFYGGEMNSYGDYIIIRKSDAHAWVEALIDGWWKRYDPTPPVRPAAPSAAALLLDSVTMVWSRYVVGFSSDDQKAIARTFAVPFMFPSLHGRKSLRLNPYFFVLPAVLATGWALARIIRRFSVARYGFPTGAFVGMRRLLLSRGYRAAEDATAGIMRKLTSGTEIGGAIKEFTVLYEAGRFGKKPLTHEQRQRYAALPKEIARTLRPKGRRP